MYLQWCAGEQLDAVAAAARAHGVALYRDLAVGVESGGAEAWGASDYVTGATRRLPAGPAQHAGSGLGFAAALAGHLERDAYATFAGLLADNMHDAGALRIDHAMSLMRLFWIPRGATAGRGRVRHLPVRRSARHPRARERARALHGDRRRPRYGAAGLPRTDGREQHPLLPHPAVRTGRATARFCRPTAYPELALATTGTHDLPPLAGWLEGDDIAPARAAGSDRRRDRAPDARARAKPGSRNCARHYAPPATSRGRPGYRGDRARGATGTWPARRPES